MDFKIIFTEREQARPTSPQPSPSCPGGEGAELRSAVVLRNCHRGATRQRQAGSTLIEMLVTMVIGLLVTATVASLSIYGGRSFAAVANYIEMETDSRNALDTMTKDIRQATYLTGFTTNQLTFDDYDGQPLVYNYSPGTKTLTKIKGTSVKVLLSGCDSLEFSVFQRTPIGGTDEAYPASSNETAKLIQVRWLCSRQIFGSTINTESVQTAKIVIRKKRTP